MAKKKGSKPEVSTAKKRSIARRFNDALAGRTPKAKKLDQRTARKLDRYRRELKQGYKGRNKKLTALEIIKRVHELLENGERITEIRKFAKPLPYEYEEDTMIALLTEMQPVYNFRPAAYQFAGIRNETLVASGVLKEMPKKRGPRKKK